MSGKSRYYLSRTAVSIAFGGLFVLSGGELWLAALLSGLTLAFFLWAPYSGRYIFHPELGVTALRRDDRTQIINDKAARSAFVITMLALAGVALYFGPAAVPAYLLSLLLFLGMLSYYATDLWLRRTL